MSAIHPALPSTLPPLDDCVAVVLFGSRASGLERADSDWDVLLVTDRKVPRQRSLAADFVCVRPSQLTSDEWLSSELASHIAHYGRWLRGDSSWAGDVRLGHAAVAAKVRRLETTTDSLLKLWPRLAARVALAAEGKIQRDLSRLSYLLEGRPVPPTALLGPDVDALRRAREALSTNVLASVAELERLSALARRVEQPVSTH